MKDDILSKINPLTASEEIRRKGREELENELKELLGNVSPSSDKFVNDENIEDEVNRLMEEVSLYEKNYIPKDIEQETFNDIQKFEEEFGDDTLEKEDEEKKDKNIISTKSQNKKEKKKKEEKKIVTEKEKEKNNSKNDIIKDKEIKEMMKKYEEQLNIEVEKEVEKEYKPSIDENDKKRAEILLEKDPLINEALTKNHITKEELILFIDYYEIFSLTNKANKSTQEHLQAIDELCLKREKGIKSKNNEKYVYYNNDEDAIDKLTDEIEKKLITSEDLLNKKLEYKKLINGKIEQENLNEFVQRLKNEKEKNAKKMEGGEENLPKIKKSSSENEFLLVPKYTLYKNKKEKKSESNTNLTQGNEKDLTPKKDDINKVNNNNYNNKMNKNMNMKLNKPKTPIVNKVKSNSLSNKKKIIPPIKTNNKNNNYQIKSKTDQRMDLFDDNSNPINLNKYRDTRKELIKLKMGGKSKIHELFSFRPKTKEENEKLKQKFNEIIKENNKNIIDCGVTKKNITRKKLEDAIKLSENRK